jgi:hypothetical protein
MKLLNEEFNNMYSSPNIIKVINLGERKRRVM